LVWSDSPHVDSVLGWQGIMPDLKTWLTSKGFLNDSLCKPKHPKKAMEEALRKTQRLAHQPSSYTWHKKSALTAVMILHF